MRSKPIFWTAIVAVILLGAAWVSLNVLRAREQAIVQTRKPPVAMPPAGVPSDVATQLVSVKVIHGDDANSLAVDATRATTVDELLERIDSFWARVDSFRVWSRMQPSAFHPWIMFTSISAERPWNVAIVPPEVPSERALVHCDGTSFVLDWRYKKTTIVGETGGTLEPLLENPFRLTQADSMMPMMQEDLFPLELFTEMPSEFWMRHAERSELIGLETVEGVPSHQLRIHFRNCHRDIWIAADGPPVPIRLDDTSTGADFYFTHWEINPKLDPSIFQAAAIPGFTRKDVDLGTPGRSLIGQPAPACLLERLDGTRVDLADRQGHGPLVLSFWGSYCGPCLQELALFPDISKSMESAGVEFLAVNHIESRAETQDFLKDKPWGRLAAIDPGGQAAALLEVSSIPHLVVIDGDGIVRLVRVGYTPRLEQMIREALGLNQNEVGAAAGPK